MSNQEWGHKLLPSVLMNSLGQAIDPVCSCRGRSESRGYNASSTFISLDNQCMGSSPVLKDNQLGDSLSLSLSRLLPGIDMK